MAPPPRVGGEGPEKGKRCFVTPLLPKGEHDGGKLPAPRSVSASPPSGRQLKRFPVAASSATIFSTTRSKCRSENICTQDPETASVRLSLCPLTSTPSVASAVCQARPGGLAATGCRGNGGRFPHRAVGYLLTWPSEKSHGSEGNEDEVFGRHTGLFTPCVNHFVRDGGVRQRRLPVARR